MRRPAALFVLTAVVALTAGCGGDPSSEPPSTAAPRDSGAPVVVDAKVDKAQVDIGDRVVYSVIVAYDERYEVDFPPVLEQFENWLIHDAGYWRDDPDLGTKKVRRIDVTLDPGLGPVLTIPPSRIAWRESGEDAWEEVLTEEITVEVVSVTEGTPEFREPVDSFELPPPPAEETSRSQLVVLGMTGGALALLAALYFVLFRKKKESSLPPLPAHEVAQRELAHLASLELVAAGRLKEYYYRLTDILRRYIEVRFGIMAPERTTEEFLVEVQSNHDLDEAYKLVLRDFLASADMVKYACHEPPGEEARRALVTAEQFVKVTISAGPPRPAEREATHAV